MLQGVICAIGLEYQAVLGRMDRPESSEAESGFPIARGLMEGVHTVVICSGTGKAAAAAATQLLLERYHPDLVMNPGIAGALVPGLGVGDVVVAERLCQGDVGVIHSRGFAHTGAAVYASAGANCVREYLADPGLVDAARRAVAGEGGSPSLPSTWFGGIVTCDQVVTAPEVREELGRVFNSLAVEMEGAAVAHVAMLHQVPFAVVRGISDTVDFDLVGLEELMSYQGESRTACWARRAKFAAVHPDRIERARQLGRASTRACESALNTGCAMLRLYREGGCR